MKLQGTNGSQVWDTEFAMQAIMESDFILKASKAQESLRKAYDFLDDMQIKQNTKQYGRYYRHINKGGFPFSTRDCGWIVSDCTAEALKSIIMANETGYIIIDLG